MGAPSIPNQKPVNTTAPAETDKAVQEAAAEAANKRKRARGYRSTLLSQMAPSNAVALQDTLGS